MKDGPTNYIVHFDQLCISYTRARFRKYAPMLNKISNAILQVDVAISYHNSDMLMTAITSNILVKNREKNTTFADNPMEIS